MSPSTTNFHTPKQTNSAFKERIRTETIFKFKLTLLTLNNFTTTTTQEWIEVGKETQLVHELLGESFVELMKNFNIQKK